VAFDVYDAEVLVEHANEEHADERGQREHAEQPSAQVRGGDQHGDVEQLPARLGVVADHGEHHAPEQHHGKE